MNIPVYQLRKTAELEYYLYCIRDIQCENEIFANQPDKITDLVKQEFSLHKLAEEEVYAVYLNQRSHVKAIVRLSHGDENMTSICHRSLFRQAFLCNANGFVLVHNHPSGDTSPSKMDIELTKSLKAGCTLLGLELYDHIIIGNEYTSLRVRGLL